MLQTKEIIRQVRTVEITTRHLVDGLIAGNYHSVFKGQGIEFSEIREYRPGDDIRTIDWKVTARLNHPFVKEFIEERDLRVYILFDYSASSNFGNRVEKRSKGIELAATLMFSAMRNNDNVGLFVFTDGVERHIPARKGRRHVLKLLSNLIAYEPRSRKTNLKKTLSFVAKVLKKRSILFIISDFIADEYSLPLSILREHHDVIALRIVDTRERNIPDVGLIQLEDEETGEQLLIDTSDEEFRKNFKKIMRHEERQLERRLKKLKIDTITVMTDEPYDIPLRKFFSRRQRRIA